MSIITQLPKIIMCNLCDEFFFFPNETEKAADLKTNTELANNYW